MKALILGGTGMLGYAIALEFLRQGHQVEAVARQAAKMGPEFDDHVKLHLLEVETAPDAEVMALMRGVDTLVYALGPDDRLIPDAPALDFFRRHLGGSTARLLALARQAGVKRAVVLGSYFVTLDRLHPEWNLAARHPYIAARVEQENLAFAAGESAGGEHQMDVMVLELPYIFGVTPGRTPFWKELLFDRLKAMPVAMYPRGGSAVVSTKQVAQATLGAALRGAHRRSYAVGDVNMSWNELVGIIRAEMGQSARVINIPPLLTSIPMRQQLAQNRKNGKDGGLNLSTLAQDIMHREFYFDCEQDRAVLGHQPGGVPEAIRQTVRDSYQTHP